MGAHGSFEGIGSNNDGLCHDGPCSRGFVRKQNNVDGKAMCPFFGIDQQFRGRERQAVVGEGVKVEWVQVVVVQGCNHGAAVCVYNGHRGECGPHTHQHGQYKA